VRNELFVEIVRMLGCAMRSGGRKRDGNLPDGGAVFRGLAVVKAQLLERLGE
jgi:hypothetical protein